MNRLQRAIDFLDPAALVPPPTPNQVHRNLRFGVVIRWILIAVIAAGGMLTPQVDSILLYVLGASALYAASAMFVISRTPQEWERRVALILVIIDHLFSFGFVAAYGSIVTGSSPLGGYSMATLEAVFFFGAPGAFLSIGIFALLAIPATVFDPPLFGPVFQNWGIVNPILMLGMTAVCIVGGFHYRLVPGAGETVRPRMVALPGGAADGVPPVRLSRREREVLRLVAEGYSNTMIATRLQLSESTVKGYVENILFHLNARNRAEAVAAASRLKLL